MKMGTSQHHNYFGSIASKILVAVCLLLAVSSWGTCRDPWLTLAGSGATQATCDRFFDEWLGTHPNASCIGTIKVNGGYSVGCCGVGIGHNYSICGNYSATIWYQCYDCDSKEEADSLKCALNPSAPGCAPPIDSAACDSYRETCEKQGGKFTGDLTPEGCRAYCNTCTSAYYNRQRNKFINACCGAGYAPPVDLDTANCTGSGIAVGTGMNYSDPLGCGGGVACDCKNPEDDPASFNQYCVGEERFDEDPSGYEGNFPPDSVDVPSDTLGEGEGDWEYNYYPILDTIRDSLSYVVVPALRDIASCLTTGTCVGGGDTVIVNVESSDSAFIKKTNSKLDSIYDVIRNGDSVLISAVQSIPVNSDSNYIKSTADSISAANDTTRKWMRRIADSVGNIGSKLDSMYNGDGSMPGDTSGSNIYDGWADGEGSDTTGNGYLMGLGSIAQAGLNDTSLDRIYGTNSSSSIGDTSIYLFPSVDSLHSALQESIDQDYQSLEDTLKNYFDTLRNEIQLINFDSAIIAPLGLKVPNTNTCPIDCFSIDLSGAGSIYSSVKGLSWPLCKSYSAMGGLNVLQFIRLILRIVTAIGCVYIGMWFIAGKK